MLDVQTVYLLYDTLPGPKMNNKWPSGDHVFQQTGTIFELFHEDPTINVASTKTAPPPGSHVFPLIMTIFELVRDIYKIDAENVTSKVKMPPPHIFEFVRDINETNVLTKFHDDCAKIGTSRVFTRNTARPHGSHVFQGTGTIFELNQHII
ncbi:hypothetical protein DPMN_026108 [Dreissena polymorpha]|uniref:Uncharacterized protein n=1 Tax=Dreissena polymorpha TaxID=45954 RepID=A0A9D4RE90_DREPO|nr:hypothetical protein DPMN_026108 [Dreissena polymorpha]